MNSCKQLSIRITLLLAWVGVMCTTSLAADEMNGCNKCQGKVTELTLRYNGEEEAFVQVTQKDGGEQVVVFEDFVQPGQPFTFAGADKYGTLGSSIKVYIDDQLAESIHTSCSKPIGPGLVAGDFEVVEGYSRKGGRLCPLPEEDDGCNACQGRVTELTLRYNGTEEALIQVTQSVDGQELVVFDDFVQPGEPFTFTEVDPQGASGSTTKIYVNGELAVSASTNCFDSMGPGLLAGSFEVIEGFSSEGGRLCPLSESVSGCDKCEGKMTELTLRYNGEEEAFVQVTQKDGGEEVVVFEGVVQPGGPFTFEGADKHGTLGSNIKLYIDGKLAESLHTSCSKPIGPGLVAGDFEVVEGFSRKGGRLCPVPGGGGDCGKCKGKVTDLTLRYNGESEAFVQVTQKGKGEGKKEVVVFGGVVQPGESFAFEGADKNGTLGSSIKIYVDDKLAESIHTSCSKPIGPGLVVGDFEVVDGLSRRGGRLCPLPEACEECAGQVTELTLRYNGEEEALVRVTQVAAGQNVVVFEDHVQPGEPFTFKGDDQQGNLGSSINISVDDQPAASFDTSCAQSIGPGLVAGDFEVVEGFSGEGGRLCAVPEDVNGCDECEGKVTELTLRYRGAEEAFVQVTQKDGDEEVVVFEGFVQRGEPFTFEGADKNGTFGSSVKIYVDDELAESLHTSCSKPVGPGLVVGDFEVVDGSSRKGGRLCAVPEEDQGCDECEGQVTELTLRYHGDEVAFVSVSQQLDDQEVMVFEDFVQPGEPFTVEGVNWEGTLGPRIKIFVDDELAASIDTNCSQPVGPGFVAEEIEVIEGFSQEGGRLCPLPDDVEGCGECEGQVTELTLRYDGGAEAFIQVTQKVGSQQVMLFEDFVQPGDSFVFEGANKHGTLGSKIEIFGAGRAAWTTPADTFILRA